MDNNITVINNTITEPILQEIKKSLPAQLQVILLETEKYLKKLNNLQSIFLAKQQAELRRQNLDVVNTAVSYAALKEAQKDNIDTDKILQEGYLLLEKIRKTFTGHQTGYLIGISYKKQIHELNLTLEDILSITRTEIDFHSQSLKLRLSKFGKGKMLSMFAKKSQIIDNNENSKNLYKRLLEYRKTSEIKLNEGQFYEAYASFKINGKYPTTKKQIDKAFAEAKNNTSWVKGGDIGDIQVKFIGSHAASLTTITTLINTFNSLKNSLIDFANNKNIKRLKDYILKTFTKQQVGNKLEKELQQDCEKYLNKFIQELNLTG